MPNSHAGAYICIEAPATNSWLAVRKDGLVCEKYVGSSERQRPPNSSKLQAGDEIDLSLSHVDHIIIVQERISDLE